MPTRILVITGEASGDHHGALVVKALQEIDPAIAVYGIGGDELDRAGMTLLYHAQSLAVVGILEVVAHAPHILKAFRTITREIRRSPPDLVLLIDYPDFNLRIARVAKQQGVPVLYYISPQIWAWRSGRAAQIAQRVDAMAVVFPFEVPLYAKVGLDVRFVGHPLLDRPEPHQPVPETRALLGLREGRPIIALLPGSRVIEIRRLLPAMLGAAGLIKAAWQSAQFVIPLVPGIDAGAVRQMAERAGVDVQIHPGRFYEALAACNLAVVASGTATLETAIMGKPMVIVYKVSPLSYGIGKLLVQVPWIGLANIVAGRQIVPELLQGKVTPKCIAQEVISMLHDRPRMEAMAAQLRSVRQALGQPGASQRVARMAYEMISRIPGHDHTTYPRSTE